MGSWRLVLPTGTAAQPPPHHQREGPHWPSSPTRGLAPGVRGQQPRGCWGGRRGAWSVTAQPTASTRGLCRVPAGGSSAEGSTPHPCRGLQGSCSCRTGEWQGRAPVLFSSAWRGLPPEAHPPWLQRELGRTVAPHPSALPSLVHFFTGSRVLGKLVALQVLSRAPDSAGAERGLGKHLMYLFSHLALSLTNSCWFFSWRR